MLEKKITQFMIPVISLILILGTLLTMGCGGPNIVEDTQSYNIAPGDQKIIKIDLEVNERVDLTVKVVDVQTGTSTLQESRDIGVQVANPSGKDVISYMRVGLGDFMILAEEAGIYIITLDNSYSSSIPKLVNLTLKYRE